MPSIGPRLRFHFFLQMCFWGELSGSSEEQSQKKKRRCPTPVTLYACVRGTAQSIVGPTLVSQYYSSNTYDRPRLSVHLLSKISVQGGEVLLLNNSITALGSSEEISRKKMGATRITLAHVIQPSFGRVVRFKGGVHACPPPEKVRRLFFLVT